jgi:hypothetical protein
VTIGPGELLGVSVKGGAARQELAAGDAARLFDARYAD